jgi:DDE superfamily endonuclease/Helix-turn-helix of DDE superfamily endonuclease
MIMRYAQLSQPPNVFQKCTGLTVGLWDQVVNDVLALSVETEAQRLNRPERQRAVGAGHACELTVRDHLLLTVSWLRWYAIHAVLA